MLQRTHRIPSLESCLGGFGTKLEMYPTTLVGSIQTDPDCAIQDQKDQMAEDGVEDPLRLKMDGLTTVSSNDYLNNYLINYLLFSSSILALS